MKGVSKALAAMFLALLLAIGVAACGGGDDADSTTEAGQKFHTGYQSKESSSDESDSSSGDSANSESQSGGGDASEFVPKQHDDAGGGSEQFKVKGGDNSVQEFGEEAATEEFDAAAVALHNFLDARAEGNWAAACEYISKSVTESLKQITAQAKQDLSCAGILEKLTNPAATQLLKEEAAKANVGSLRIEGEQAFLIYTGIDGTVLAMSMANEDGNWKVASLAGSPLS